MLFVRLLSYLPISAITLSSPLGTTISFTLLQALILFILTALLILMSIGQELIVAKLNSFCAPLVFIKYAVVHQKLKTDAFIFYRFLLCFIAKVFDGFIIRCRNITSQSSGNLLIISSNLSSNLGRSKASSSKTRTYFISFATIFFHISM